MTTVVDAVGRHRVFDSAHGHSSAGPRSGVGTGGRPLHWFVVAAFIHSTNAGLDILTGPTGLIGNAIWLVIYAVCISLLADDVLRRRRPVRWPALAVLFAGLTFASASWSAAPLVSLQSSLLFAGTLVLATTVVQKLSPVQILRALRTAMLLVAMASLLLYAAGVPQVIDGVHGTLRGVLVQKNSLGQAMMIGVLAAALAGTLDPSRRRSDVLASVPMLVAIGLTDSASAMLITAVGLLLLSVAWLRALHRYLVPAACLVVGTVLVSLRMFGALTTGTLFSLLGRDTTFTGRTDIWAASLQALERRPLTGYGNDAFWQHSTVASDIKFALGFQVAHAHNGFLDVALELGLPGAALAFALVIVVLADAVRRWYRGQRTIAAFQLGAGTIAVAVNIGESGLLNENNLVTTLLLMAAAMSRSIVTPGSESRSGDAHGPGDRALRHEAWSGSIETSSRLRLE